ncbi:protein AF1q [Scyliorhinus canicula]|uniref:protein AF1q n=1 Tax=Scyliorhinus canicula TaxID=7830 RepID=UPI0018F522AA|nr:protein AF1q [Scyliorhinus canicula]XP_038643204.1 protein AF1q [Scyliorhinus canicula]XP_038643205.1 protein AF1q [Scyliorhinus canicula]
MLDFLNSQFDSFLFWRTPIPMIDLSEIEVLGLPVPNSGSGGQAKPYAPQAPSEGEKDGTLAKYNSFNFWRAPIASFSRLELELL